MIYETAKATFDSLPLYSSSSYSYGNSNSPVSEKSGPNPFTKTLNSVQEIGQDLYNNAQTRADKALDSPEDFANYVTSGAVDGVKASWEAAGVRADKAFDSPYDFANWLTLGLVEMADGAINPEDPFSKEHLLDSFGLASLAAGGAALRTATGGSRSGGSTDGTTVTKNRGSQVAEGTGKIIDPKVVDEILATDKGLRPNPSTYLLKEYIDSHLAMFDGGVAKIQWGAPTRALGPPSGTFVMPKSVADDLIAKSGGDVSKLEQLLSLDPGTLGSAPVRVDIPTPTGLRMPDGNEVGANSQWIPGGYTGGGIPEATIDQVPLDKLIVTELFK